MTENTPAGTSWKTRLLWIIAILSLGLNLFLIVNAILLRNRVGQELAAQATALDGVFVDTFQVPVVINEMLPLSMTVAFSDTFHVPISTTIPVSTTVVFTDTFYVPVNEFININRNLVVSIDIPILGLVPIDIPIVTSIPVVLDIEVPVSTTIPIRTDIPVNLEVDIPVSSEIPINTSVPVLLDFPVTIDLSGTGVHTLVDQLQEALYGLARQMGADVPEPDPAP